MVISPHRRRLLAPKQVFVTAPILTGGGVLVAASDSAVHAYAFG
jgi:tRNA G46 methylase TrmB